jgi:hypothetical protein
MSETSFSILKKMIFIPSIICTLGVIIMILSYKIKRSPQHLNLLFLSLNDLIYYISILLPFDEKEIISNVCLTQGLLTNFTKQGSIIWYFIISYTCLINTLNSKYYLQNKVKFTIIYLLCSLIIPFIYCLYLYFFDLIGNDIYYCNIFLKSELMKFYIMKNQCYILFFEIFEYFLNLFCYKKCSKYILNIEKNTKKKNNEHNKNNKLLIKIPFIYLIISPIGILNTFFRIYSYLQINFLLEYLNLFSEGFKGIFIFIIFSLNIHFSKVKKNMKKIKLRKKKKYFPDKKENSLLEPFFLLKDEN